MAASPTLRKRNLRIGILCDCDHLAEWQANCLVALLETAGVELAVAVVKQDSIKPARLLARLARAPFDPLLLWKIFQRRALFSKARSLDARSLREIWPDARIVPARVRRVGRFKEALADDDLEMVKSHDLDILIRFGFGILTGPILETPKFGIWSFHHGDPFKYRGAPPGFWEIARRDPVTGVILQRLTERLDGGIILDSAWFKTLPKYSANLDKIYFGATHLLTRSVKRLLADPGWTDDLQPSPTNAPVFRHPTNRQMLGFAATSFLWRLKGKFSALFRHSQWGVGLVDNPVEDWIEKPDFSSACWLAEPRSGYLADPFLLPQKDGNSEIRLLAEELDWRTGKGTIVEITSSRKGEIRSRTAGIKDECHLSYPFVLAAGDELLCVPEMADAGRVEVYRRNDETKSWDRHAVWLEGFAGLDPTLFEHRGKWWLFCTDAEQGPNEMLYCWHSDSLEGPWTPHLLNPVKIDIRSSRPAGAVFSVGEALYRPAQDCSTHYGAAIQINRIVELTPCAFREEPVARLTPDTSSPYPHAMHTINSNGRLTVIDAARLSFSFGEFLRATGLARRGAK